MLTVGLNPLKAHHLERCWIWHGGAPTIIQYLLHHQAMQLDTQETKSDQLQSLCTYSVDKHMQLCSVE